MIAYYDHKPPQIEAMGNGKYFYRWDIEEVGLPENVFESYQSEEVNEPTQEDIDSIIVREAVAIEEVEHTEDATNQVEGNIEKAEEVEPQKPSMWKCQEVVFEPPMTTDNIAMLVADEVKVEKGSEEYEALYREVGLVVIPLDMEAAKKELKDKILAYDSSDAVNAFTFGGIPMWLDKATRVGLKLRFEAELALGKDSTTLWLNGMDFTLPLSGEQSAMNMLTALEVYASASYDVTQMHLAQVAKMATAEEILGYDWTSGYPEKLSF